jgi:polyvinyl alcohol dehydrogenase (cytochrome)
VDDSSGPPLTGVDPSRRRFLATVPVAALGFALVGCSSDPATKDRAAPTTARTPRGGSAAEAGSEQWAMYGHDHAQTRANVAETAITRSTVSKLSPGWTIDDLVGVTGTPLSVDGVAYVADWTGAVRAVDVEDGKERWKCQVGGMIVGACALDGDAVYVSSGVSLFRLDRATGEQVWTAKTDDHPQAQINASPVVIDGMVLQGTASFENMVAKDQYEFRGSIAAFDASTGEKRWQFFTTPGDRTAGAGAGIWSTPAIDTERGLLYVGTGQGLSDPTAPLVDSLLAIHYRTGKLEWSTQFTYPDVFSAAHPDGKDADVGGSPNLWTSKGRDLVGAGDKGGTFHALDRDSGEIVWEAQLTPGSVFGGQIGSAALVDGSIIASSNVGDPDTNSPTDRARVFALDPATGKERWSSPALEGKIFAPVSAVPGVAFVGTDRGRLHAYDTRSGEELWTADAPAPTACGPSIVDGQILWGYGFTLFSGPGDGGLLSFTVGDT